MRFRRAAGRAVRVVRFLGYYVRELVAANVLVARTVVWGRPPIHPAVVRYTLSVRSDLRVTLFANLISLTPGVLTLDVDEDAHVLWVHALHVTSPDDLRQHLAELERRFEEAFSAGTSR